jgi:hypothetical protein
VTTPPSNRQPLGWWKPSPVEDRQDFARRVYQDIRRQVGERPRGPVEQAIRSHLHEGQLLHTPTQRKPFQVGRIDTDGLVLLLGAGEWPARLTWDCLEGVAPFLRERGTIPIGGRHVSAPNPGTLDEWLKGCTQVDTAGWVAVVLEEAGVVEIVRGRPARVRLRN